ncbi:MAG: hypothetical protein U9O94_07920 [Nanoarchaeota archaeon]|nr:hypothetical protein [Nanoarchaeota archaeon]
MNYKKLILLLVTLLVIPLSFALSLDEEPEECQDVEFIRPSTWMGCGLAKMYQNAVGFLITPVEQITEAFGELMIIQIDISTLGPYWAKINYVASAFIVLMIIYAGYMWMFSAIDAEKRKIAKQQTIDLIYVIIFVNLSLIFGWLLIEITNSIVTYVWRAFLNQQISDLTVTEIILNGASTFILMFLYVIVFILIGIPFFIKIISRHLVVMILICLLPIIILLYYFTPTKQFGKKLIEVLIINSVFPFVWMLVFAMGKVAVNVIQDLFLPVDFGILSFLALTSTLYINNKLYKQIGLNFDIASPVTYTVQSVKKIYTKVPGKMKSDVRQFRDRVKERWNSKKDIPYGGYDDTIGSVVDK